MGLIAIITCLALGGLCCGLVASSNIRVSEVCGFWVVGVFDLMVYDTICCGV